jgi:hypothetical protein
VKLTIDQIMSISRTAARVTCRHSPWLTDDVAQDVALDIWWRESHDLPANAFIRAKMAKYRYIHKYQGEPIHQVPFEDNIASNPRTFRRVAGFWQFEKTLSKLTAKQKHALRETLIGRGARSISNAAHRAIESIKYYPLSYRKIRTIKEVRNDR